ncbi:hypothetical protein BurJ1DRAFT_3424 [Burkholderiales bacterium JOSHI_001]|nr:hypothetical protein BurJ1DRAFT_3424 [Burkholderiales bacterium JOSHI_001]
MPVQLLSLPSDLLSVALPTLPPELAAVLAPSDVPLLLLPVRVETRFFALPDTVGTAPSLELRIRVYPDQVHVDSHEPALSTDEFLWGQHFWQQVWRAGHDEAAERLAWQQLCSRFDAQRAAWIARALRPDNVNDWPSAPVPAEQPLPVPPRLAAAAMQADAQAGGWQRAPLAKAMPQRWVAVATARGAVVGCVPGAPISAEPAVGPNPKDSTAAPDDQLALDDGMRWMVDFDRAALQGMGLRMKLPAAVAQQGIETLVVFGVSSLAPDAAAQAWAALLDAQHYSGGLGFLRLGTPTNNSSDAASGWSSQDPLHLRSFSSECRAPALAADSNAALLGRAFGFDEAATQASLRTLWDAPLREQADARQMATALWPATWGYHLMNLVGLDGTGLTLEHLDWARQHFIDHVRPFGPLPTLRVGRQPYGVLPVTPLAGDAASVPDARERWLASTLKTLADRLWYPHTADVPRVGRSSDPAQDLAAVLGSDAVAASYRLRFLLGPRYIEHLRRFMGEDLSASGWLAAQDQVSRAVLNALGFAWHPRLEDAAYAESVMAVSAPLVQAGPLDEATALAPNYIAALLADPPLPATESTLPPPLAAPASLLHLLLRHALQLEYTVAAARHVAKAPGAPPLASLLRERELVNLNAATAVRTWRMLLTQASPQTGNLPPAAFLKAQQQFDSAELKPLGELRQALSHLQTLAPATLERLLKGTLDVASHRIDAWITSLATRRLAAQRAQKPLGLRLGGYGWVLNLKPAAAPTPVNPPHGESGPMFTAPGDPGFVHAPSVMQAQTAALLRNSHLNHAREGAQDLFAVDLSSRRVRLAMSLLEGVRQGQPLGALLGYLFERKLHEFGHDADIDEFRRIAPLQAVNAPSVQPAEAIAANNVVDGLELPKALDRLSRLGFGFPTPDMLARLRRCERELALLNDAIDALSDAAVAECAFQAVRGNVVKTGTTLQALANGEAPPPELEVVRTPRTGTAATHRVVALFNPVAAPASPVSPRAKAEPTLNAWAARLLGNFKRVRFAVDRLAADGRLLKTLDLRLSDLALQPLDLVHLAPARPGEPAPEIDQRALARAEALGGPLAPGEALRLDRQRKPAWLASEIGLDEVTELAARARQLFAGLRALDARDLRGLQGSFDARTDAAEFDARAQAARKALASATSALLALLKNPATAKPAALGAAIAALSRFGMAGSAPLEGAAPEALLVQAAAVAQEAQRRVARAPATLAPPELLRAVFGEAFVALPRFTLEDPGELTRSLAASTELQGGDALAVVPWLLQLQRVREPLARLGASLQAAEVAGSGATLRLAVAQLPQVPGDRWIGLPAASDKTGLPAGRLSLVVHAEPTLKLAQPLAGVLVDEWVELVPAASETTAITFQHDAPDQRAPQALLLAVPASSSQAWTGATLHRLLLDTLAQAQVRAIDAEALDTAVLNPLAGAPAVAELAHFLPALHFAVNVDGDAVAPDFRSLTS